MLAYSIRNPDDPDPLAPRVLVYTRPAPGLLIGTEEAIEICADGLDIPRFQLAANEGVADKVIRLTWGDPKWDLQHEPLVERYAELLGQTAPATPPVEHHNATGDQP